MGSSETRRHDLYNGLTELLGADRADTLMTYLPSRPDADYATHADIRRVEARVDEVETSLGARIDKVETNLTARIDQVEMKLTGQIDALHSRLDRIVYAVIAALIAIIARTFF